MGHATLAQFKKCREFLVCADSDGCAMDTMTSKHQLCFCPSLIRTYRLEAYADLITPEWMRVNLYSATRGINRFKGLAQMLDFLEEHGVQVPGRAAICHWAKTAPILSNDALQAAITHGDTALQSALDWSRAVNEVIAGMGVDAQPFPGCKETLSAISVKADTAVVSSANSAAVEEEWTRCALAPHMDLLLGQEAGSKTHCLRTLVGKGYQAEHVLMVGDALGDLDAARQANVLFFPILVGHECESWTRLRGEAFPRLLSGTFTEAYQERLIAQQQKILG